jgi:hypothetical protein
MGTPKEKNIRPRDTEPVMWDSSQPMQSLRDLRLAVEEEALKGINWYWTAKQWKCRFSRGIQFAALALTALGGIVPVIVQLVRNSDPQSGSKFDSGIIASLCIGLAAALVGLDKAFGFSTGWTRYVLTATTMTKLLHEFRLEWVASVAAAKDPPTAEQQAALIQQAKDFLSTIHSMILQETKDWATEFQSNMAQMEKDLKSQLESLKSQVEKSAKAKEDATKPGSIELTLTNADKTDGYRFEVILEGPTGKFTDTVSNGKVWARLNTAPGPHKVSIEAKAKGSAYATSSIIEVKSAETSKPSLTLPIP